MLPFFRSCYFLEIVSGVWFVGTVLFVLGIRFTKVWFDELMSPKLLLSDLFLALVKPHIMLSFFLFLFVLTMVSGALVVLNWFSSAPCLSTESLH